MLHHSDAQNKIFIAGSISIKSLSENDISFINEIVESNHTILIGDAFGLDKAIQEFLLKCCYRNVIVYFSGDKARNNLGNWLTKQNLNPDNLTGKSFYQIKDKAMAKDCDCGLFFGMVKVKELNTI